MLSTSIEAAMLKPLTRHSNLLIYAASILAALSIILGTSRHCIDNKNFSYYSTSIAQFYLTALSLAQTVCSLENNFRIVLPYLIIIVQ